MARKLSRYRNRSAIAVVAMALAVGGALVLNPAKAAAPDECCADLEARVAELEASMARRTKTQVELYGIVNIGVIGWDDGQQEGAHTVGNSYKSSRFGFKSQATISGDWSAGYRLELEATGDRSRALDQEDVAGPRGTAFVRQSYMYVASETFGKLSWGLQNTPKDNTTKDTLVAGDISETTNSDFFLSQGFFLRSADLRGAGSLSDVKFIDIARCYSSRALFDCSPRRNMVEYQSPVLAGFWLTAGRGEDTIWEVAARYKEEWGGIWKVGAGLGYENLTDERGRFGGGGLAGFRREVDEWSGSASIMHLPSGLWAFGAFSTSENNDSNRIHAGVFTKTSSPEMVAYDFSIGIQRAFNTLGKTTLWGGYTDALDGIAGVGGPTRAVAPGEFPGVDIPTEITGAKVTRWYLAADQAVEGASLNLYLVYQHIDPNVDLVDAGLNAVAAPLEDFDLVFVGARIHF